MKVIEEFCRIMKEDALKTGVIQHNSQYIVKLDKDDLISHICFSHAPDKKYLASCNPAERELITKWYNFKLETMDKWKDLYNESVKSYNDYCGKRAGEDGKMLDLVLQGCSISNVVPFNPAAKKKAQQKGVGSTL